jgi:aromatic-L-amino-acid decarboxylase
VDALAERLDGLADAPVGRRATRSEMEERLREPLPEQGSDPDAVLDAVLRDVLPPGLRIDHPRFFAFVPVPGNPVGSLADALLAGSSTFAGTWLGSPGAAMVELVVLEWLRGICGLPEGTEGLFVSGGSMANLTGLAIALSERAGGERSRAAIYLSDETHSSVGRALAALGVGHVRVLRTDGRQRLVPAAVAEAVAADRAHGLLPVAVVATAGTTGTGAVDPLPELARLGLWMHVDGAYGAAAALSERGRAQLPGLELADSLSLDPHKWLFQPLESGCVLVRDGAAMKRTFTVEPAYLRVARAADETVNFADRGLQLTRQSRALKLWMSLKVFGAAAFREAIEHGFALAEHAQALLEARPEWEVVTPASLGIVTFRHVRADEALTGALPAAMMADGFAFASTTTVHGETVLRLCTINPRTTHEDVERTLDVLAELAAPRGG